MKKTIYMKTVYYNVETGEELKNDFKKKFYYQLLDYEQTTEIIKQTNFVRTNRAVKITGERPKQLSLFEGN